MYRINIQVLNTRGEELVTKQLKINNLDNILDTDLAGLYAEAQQNELFDGQTEYDETDDYQESFN